MLAEVGAALAGLALDGVVVVLVVAVAVVSFTLVVVEALATLVVSFVVGVVEALATLITLMESGTRVILNSLVIVEFGLVTALSKVFFTSSVLGSASGMVVLKISSASTSVPNILILMDLNDLTTVLMKRSPYLAL